MLYVGSDTLTPHGAEMGLVRSDYWLYAVFNCVGTRELHAIQDPSRLGRVPVVQVEHYHIDPGKILAAHASGGHPKAGIT